MMISTVGLPPPVAAHAAVVSELYEIVDTLLPEALYWEEGRCELNLIGLLGGEAASQRQLLLQHYGAPHTEWIPSARYDTFISGHPPQQGAVQRSDPA